MPKPSPAKKNRSKSPKSSQKKPSRLKASAKISSRNPKKTNRKVTPSARRSAVVSKRAQVSGSKRVSRSTPKPEPRRKPKINPVRTASVKQYEAAVKLLYSHEYEKAKPAFEKVITEFADDKEVVERSRIHLRLCEQKMARKPVAPRTLDEHYDWAIALMNEGKYEESIDHLNKALKSNPKCDYVIYALAITHCRIGNFERALASLQTAIGLKPENRFLAQRDSDFEVLKQDSRFMSLVFPDQPSASIR